MGAYAIRMGEFQKQETPLTPADAYKSLNADQFIQFARIFLKDKIMGSDYSIWNSNLTTTDKQNMNRFFESIPDYLIDFSSDASRKLLMMHITTNMEYGFGCALSEIETDDLFRYVDRLAEIDPRISTR